MFLKINFLYEATKWILKGVHTNYYILLQQVIETASTVIVEGLMFMIEINFYFQAYFKIKDYKMKLWKSVKCTHLNYTWTFRLVR